MVAPDEVEVKSRDQFVTQVAKNIERSLSDNVDEAYIFGLSGKWGEGKTTFLESLEMKLPKHVRVIRVNPWKYADDKISFLRVFLKKINDIAPYSSFFEEKHSTLNKTRHVFRWLTKRIRQYKLRPLYDDVSKKHINYPILFAVFGGVLVLIFVYSHFIDDQVKGLIIANKWFITALFLPIVLAVGQALITSQKSYHALTTLDSFDNLIHKITRKFTHFLFIFPRNTSTKVVIFVDDLDRVTGSKAIEVLDNLRTFFDNQSFAFIVAGDHTVIERHLGRELLPDGRTAEQNEEGRRFLKKIFNVYWRLPLPIKPEVDQFIDEKILTYKTEKGRRLTKIGRALKNQEYRDVFKGQLSYYFENNYRNILRFVDRVIFTFEVIESQLENPEIDDNKMAYFKEMKQKPLLVIRALLLEEIANPIHEKVLADTSIFHEMEMAATKHSSLLEDNLSKYGEIISEKQRDSLRHLLSETPRFFGETGVQVLNLKPYFFLSSDSSFGDERGLSPRDFLERLRNPAIADVKHVIEQSGSKQMKAAIAGLLTEVTKQGRERIAAAMLTKLYVSMLMVDPKFEVQVEVRKQIDPSVVASALKAAEEEETRRTLLISYTTWLQYVNVAIGSPFEFAKSLSVEDISALSNEEVLNLELSKLVVGWFVNTFNSVDPSAFDIFGKVISNVNKDALSGYLVPIKDPLIDAYVMQSLEENRRQALHLIDYLGSEAKLEVKDKILHLLSGDDLTVWNRSEEYVKHQLVSHDELDEMLVKGFENIVDYPTLRRRMAFVADKLRNTDLLWAYLVREKRSLLMDSFVSFRGQQNYLAALSPSEQYAAILFKEAYDHINGSPNEYITLQHFNRNHLYFTQLDRLPNRVAIANRYRHSKSINRYVKDRLGRILNNDWPASKKR